MGKGSKRRPCHDTRLYGVNLEKVRWGNKKKSHKSDRRKAKVSIRKQEDR